MRRVVIPVLLTAAVGLLSGCYNVVYPNQRSPHPEGGVAMWAVEEPWVEPAVLGDYELCAFANDAVRTIITELWAAPDDKALTKQTTDSYLKYANRLRELAVKAETPQRKALIEKAATAAEKYAKAVEKKKTFKGVDIDPAITASQDAFPGCDLDR